MLDLNSGPLCAWGAFLAAFQQLGKVPLTVPESEEWAVEGIFGCRPESFVKRAIGSFNPQFGIEHQNGFPDGLNDASAYSYLSASLLVIAADCAGPMSPPGR